MNWVLYSPLSSCENLSTRRRSHRRHSSTSCYDRIPPYSFFSTVQNGPITVINSQSMGLCCSNGTVRAGRPFSVVLGVVTRMRTATSTRGVLCVGFLRKEQPITFFLVQPRKVHLRKLVNHHIPYWLIRDLSYFNLRYQVNVQHNRHIFVELLSACRRIIQNKLSVACFTIM
jgi:hypothetical protein